MRLYENLHEKYNKMTNLDINSVEDIKYLTLLNLSRVRVLNNMLHEVMPFHGIIGGDEIQKTLRILESWEQRLSEKSGLLTKDDMAVGE